MASVIATKAPTTTAEDTLKAKSRDANVVSGGHLVAKALKNEGVDTIFALGGGHPSAMGVSTTAFGSSMSGTRGLRRTLPTGNSPFPGDITVNAGRRAAPRAFLIAG